MNDVRVTIRLHNNILIEARNKLNLSQRDMAKFCDISSHVYQAFECLTAHPNDSENHYDCALKIATVLEMPIGKIFSEHLTKIKINKQVAFTRSDIIAQLPERKSPYELIESKEIIRYVNEKLRDLSPREEKILRMRFGIGEEKQTVNEIADDFAVTRSRVRQIETKGFKNLTHKILKADQGKTPLKPLKTLKPKKKDFSTVRIRRGTDMVTFKATSAAKNIT